MVKIKHKKKFSLDLTYLTLTLLKTVRGQSNVLC